MVGGVAAVVTRINTSYTIAAPRRIEMRKEKEKEKEKGKERATGRLASSFHRRIRIRAMRNRAAQRPSTSCYTVRTYYMHRPSIGTSVAATRWYRNRYAFCS